MSTKIRGLQSLSSGIPTTDGDGVKMTRLIGTPELNMLDAGSIFIAGCF